MLDRLYISMNTTLSEVHDGQKRSAAEVSRSVNLLSPAGRHCPFRNWRARHRHAFWWNRPDRAQPETERFIHLSTPFGRITAGLLESVLLPSSELPAPAESGGSSSGAGCGGRA